jgi:hypothetical protein
MAQQLRRQLWACEPAATVPQAFAAALDARPRHEDPEQDLESLGLQYLACARERPLEYRLMFSTIWPESAVQADLVGDATGLAKAGSPDDPRYSLPRSYRLPWVRPLLCFVP